MAPEPTGTRSRSVTLRRAELDALDDAPLVLRCREGDSLAWDVLVRRYRRLVFAIPLRAGLGPDESEDVFHSTFVRLAERIDSLREPERARSWIVTTARRLVIDAIRARQTARAREAPEEALDDRADPAPLPPEDLEGLERRHLLRRGLERLGERCRRLLTRLFFGPEGGAPVYEDVARELGMPVGSIGPTRARCLAKLRTLVESADRS